jgi:uncharacterized membrane protein YccC
MPTDTVSPALDQALRNRRVLRLAFGTTLALWISQAFGWPLSFVAPILTLVVLALPVSRPGARFFGVLFIALTGSVYVSFILLPMLIHQRMAGLLILSLALFHCFYFTARGGAAIIGVLLTIGLSVMAAVGSVSVDALIAVAHGVTFAAIVGLGIAWFSHVLLPDPAESGAKAADSGAKPPADVARRHAMRALAIVLPITIWFLYSSASAANTAVMIKVAAMGQEASVGGTRKAAKSLLISTLAGGFAAVVAWQFLQVWPSLTMYTLLVGIAALVFGAKIFKGRGLQADGETWSYALLTMIVVLAPAVLDSQFGTAANARFYDRLLMFMGASAYGVVAVYVYDAFFPGTKQSIGQTATPESQP